MKQDLNIKQESVIEFLIEHMVGPQQTLRVLRNYKDAKESGVLHHMGINGTLHDLLNNPIYVRKAKFVLGDKITFSLEDITSGSKLEFASRYTFFIEEYDSVSFSLKLHEKTLHDESPRK